MYFISILSWKGGFATLNKKTDVIYLFEQKPSQTTVFRNRLDWLLIIGLCNSFIQHITHENSTADQSEDRKTDNHCSAKTKLKEK
jgi:hypothetical protein